MLRAQGRKRIVDDLLAGQRNSSDRYVSVLSVAIPGPVGTVEASTRLGLFPVNGETGSVHLCTCVSVF